VGEKFASQLRDEERGTKKMSIPGLNRAQAVLGSVFTKKPKTIGTPIDGKIRYFDTPFKGKDMILEYDVRVKTRGLAGEKIDGIMRQIRVDHNPDGSMAGITTSIGHARSNGGPFSFITYDGGTIRHLAGTNPRKDKPADKFKVAQVRSDLERLSAMANSPKGLRHGEYHPWDPRGKVSAKERSGIVSFINQVLAALKSE